MIYGNMDTKIIYGCLEKYPPDNKKSRDTIGYFFNQDIINFNPINPYSVPKNYIALLFITEKLSSPDKWVM